MIEETYYGMRIDVFLPKSPIAPPMKKQGWKTQKEEEKIREDLIRILEQHNRLPDDEVVNDNALYQKKLGTLSIKK